MRIKLFGKTIFEKEDVPVAPQQEKITPSSYYETSMFNRRVIASPFDGEKNLGEMGPIRKYVIDHEALRLRAWQNYLESEIGQISIKRLTRWVIGSGLKLQAEPKADVLLSEKITLETEEFNKTVEARFGVFANSRMSDYSNLRSLHVMANEAYENSLMGDVLVILRYINGEVKVELKDGAHVRTPLGLGFNGVDFIAENGNRVRNGIELDAKGEHIAYYIQTGLFGEYNRLVARGAKSGMLMVFMVYGMKYRLDSVRSIPRLTAVMETLKKMERYKEATLGSAEEAAKIAYFIKHGKDSDGEAPYTARAANAYDYNPNAVNDLPRDIRGKQLANTVAASVNKTVYNLTQDSDMGSLESDKELYFKDFYNVNTDIVCATVGIPPNVAMSKYDSNYSASRAAIKDWEHTITVERKYFYDQFYVPVYNFWLQTQILTNKIQAPGYLTALSERNTMAIEAYQFARFVGAKVPHIDPMKEVQAERAKLGGVGANLPLTTAEAATEAVSEGDYSANVIQFARELEDAETLGIPSVIPAANNTDNTEEDDKKKKDE
jgi:capsid protein